MDLKQKQQPMVSLSSDPINVRSVVWSDGTMVSWMIQGIGTICYWHNFTEGKESACGVVWMQKDKVNASFTGIHTSYLNAAIKHLFNESLQRGGLDYALEQLNDMRGTPISEIRGKGL